MSNSFTQGAGYALTGLRWLPKAGLRGFVAIPLLINTLLFGGGIWWGANQLQRLDRAVQGWLPDWLAWLHWLLWPLFVLTVLVVVFYTFSLAANVIAAPFNGLLAARVERMIDPAGRVPPRPAETSWRELLLSPLGELRKLLYFVAWAIPPLVLSFVPAVNMVAPVVWAVSTAWMLALEYADYPLGNRGMGLKAQRQLLRQRPLLVLGFGGMTLLLTLIPVLNFLAMPAAVIGATLLWNKELSDSA
ncbi:MAG: sulfate transporter CysZ [Candidatus Contendobacter sp.]|nr:sulfate transporter CysZ [Candidatus Contendobacter sp.]MDS4059456.1 sulfate transporter CysZ [Candidatus Contendobacter sp.]